MTMPQSVTALLVLVATTLWAPIVASTQSTTAPADPSSVIIPIVVTDAQGAPIRGIAPADLVVRVNKTPARIVGISTPMDSPLRVAVLIDTSGSQRSNRSAPAAVNALGLLMPHLLNTEQDRAIVITFGGIPTATDFMDRDQMRAFSMHLSPYGSTALYDAIALACDRFTYDNIASARRVLIVLTDGDDDASRTSLEGAVKVLQRSHAIMFLVDTGAKSSESRLERHRRQVYNEFAEKTGSIVYVENPPQDMATIFSAIKQQIDSMDIVNCVGTESDKKGHHTIQIWPATNNGWRVHASQGYDDK